MIFSSAAADFEASPVISAISEFSLELYRQQMGARPENIVVSPLSVHLVLTALSSGADSETKIELQLALHLENERDAPADYASLIHALNTVPRIAGEPPFLLDLANAVWIQRADPVKPAFEELLKQQFRVHLQSIDFTERSAVAREINRWITDKTGNRISSLVTENEIDPLSRMILTSAIYFKSRWEHSFQPELTTTQPFFIKPDEQVQAQLMCDVQTVSYFENQNLQLVSLPFSGGELEFILALPAAKDGLAKLEKELTGEKLNDWLRQMKNTKVEYSLPRFAFSTRAELSSALKALGISRIFDADKVSFPGMSDGQQTSLSKILHEGSIAVDEHGAAVTAATAAILVGSGSTSEQPKVFRADHPFMFFLIHKRTNALLFLGRVVRPSEPEKTA